MANNFSSKKSVKKQSPKLAFIPQIYQLCNYHKQLNQQACYHFK